MHNVFKKRQTSVVSVNIVLFAWYSNCSVLPESTASFRGGGALEWRGWKGGGLSKGEN